MRVKRLEIQGFKSFKDKTTIHFDHGITGIVGPNGCGKSNIVDAFFWVMGEQSYKHMRGNGSEDLIFNGSSKYAPLGMAEATLVMETDAVDTENAPAGASAAGTPIHLRTKEVSVTRRLYRSGEGEYFVNGLPARLKDIQELFMDTGVGAKGYSVIEQGQIGKIVNAKPEDRRLLVEEAAGIAKYKARKKESLRKMEATQANLSRLTDVIQEIERNLGSLERQAQKARQYRKFKDELLDKEMTWGRRKSLVMRQKLQSLQVQKVALEQELVGLRAELQALENRIEVDRVNQLTDTKIAEDLQSRIQLVSDDLTRERSALDLSRRRQGDLASQLAALNQEKQELDASVLAERERLASREAEAEQANQSFDLTSKNAKTQDEKVRQARSETEASRQRLESLKRELMAGITQSSDLTSRGAALEGRIESAQAQAARLTQQAESQAAKVEAAREEAQRCVESAETIRGKRDELRSELQAQSDKTRTQEQELRKLQSTRNEASRALVQLKSRLQSLEELASAHEGLADGPKSILEWAKSTGNCPELLTVADALEIEEGFDGVAEAWLESQLEDLLTGDARIAADALGALRSENQAENHGRAAIQVGVTAPSKTLKFDRVRSVLEASGFTLLGELAQFVKPDQSVTPAIREMATGIVASVAVVESFEPMADFLAALSVDASEGFAKLGGWSIVSRDGNVLELGRGGAAILRGGSLENDGTASLLRRKRAIIELQVQVTESERVLGEAESALQNAEQDFDVSKARLAVLQNDLQELQIQAAGMERDVHQTTRALKDAENQFQSIQREIAQTADEESRARADREKIEGRIAEIAEARSGLESSIAEGEGELASKDAEFRQYEAELQTIRVEEASLRERATSLRRELEAGRALISDRQRRLTEINRTLERAAHEREEFSGGESDLEQRIQELTGVLGGARAELSTVKNRIEESSAKLNSGLDQIKDLHKNGDQKTADSNQLALELEKLGSDLSHLVQNLEEKYGPGCLERPVTSPIQEEMTEPVVTAEMTAEEEQALGEEVERLRERIRRLGEVNVMAIEEFEELKKRYDFLLTEKKDLEHSIENLQEAIEHINKTSEERFKKAFEAIADRFERLFPIIFGGGHAKLSLVYPEGSSDILDAGVDILAQPPGKKIVNIGLLSGGEKALTAVSLIFAIFLVKPSPFCVLDEVDAPLDDANIGKFNALLREMSAKSQFILITHNKKTMELNDTLYGVTMEEPGVSKMVSIEMQ
ncbi:MAG: chromosome segregation protein SMC [Bdellovibrionales bacterium RIFOXYC1_FULL_54_43]|nr:MAG: chromosome segregation protein SMC [Bdellovibrionales bacterium RIFOXYC1_FULL_54_43]